MSDESKSDSKLRGLLPSGRFSFGLREAIIVSVIGIAITIAAAIHYGT